jgi:16S rRNA (cytidine1402-2'-O)-methyltransferase
VNQNNTNIGMLLLVGTPLGNLSDISARALDTLRSCDFIAAEDTRVTSKLLARFEIKKPIISCYEHNEKLRSAEIISRLLSGETCAYVTDAGMPCISDPGSVLVRECISHNIAVSAIPGAAAFVTAAALSGLDVSRFSFEGFLSVNTKQRREHLSTIKDYPNTLIFYEAPHKLLKTLQDLRGALGDRDIAVCRELTKIYEETLRGTFSDIIAHFTAVTPRGEFVIVISGQQPESTAETAITLDSAAVIAVQYVEDGYTISDAAKMAAKCTPFSKSQVYAAVMKRNAQGE